MEDFKEPQRFTYHLVKMSKLSLVLLTAYVGRQSSRSCTHPITKSMMAHLIDRNAAPEKLELDWNSQGYGGNLPICSIGYLLISEIYSFSDKPSETAKKFETKDLYCHHWNIEQQQEQQQKHDEEKNSIFFLFFMCQYYYLILQDLASLASAMLSEATTKNRKTSGEYL